MDADHVAIVFWWLSENEAYRSSSAVSVTFHVTKPFMNDTKTKSSGEKIRITIMTQSYKVSRSTLPRIRSSFSYKPTSSPSGSAWMIIDRHKNGCWIRFCKSIETPKRSSKAENIWKTEMAKTLTLKVNSTGARAIEGRTCSGTILAGNRRVDTQRTIASSIVPGYTVTSVWELQMMAWSTNEWWSTLLDLTESPRRRIAWLATTSGRWR